MCVSVSAWEKKKLRDMEGILKKVQEKFGQERKFKQEKFLNLKVLRLWLLLGKVP